MMDIFDCKKVGLFAGGVLFGTAGVKLLSSKDAKKAYTNCAAAALRVKDCVMKDVLAQAKEINEERYAKEAEAVEEDEPCGEA